MSSNKALRKAKHSAFQKKQEEKGWEKRSGKKPRKQPRPHRPSKKGHRKKFNK